MDSAFQGMVLDTIWDGKHSVRLTNMVNNVLEERMPDINREHVMGFCKKLLVGDDNPPMLNEKSLPYIARAYVGDPPAWKVVVNVTQLNKNLKEVLLNRALMYKQLHIIKDPVTILKTCLKMIMSDPRKYTADELGVIIHGTVDDTTSFTYIRKYAQGAPSAKRGESALEEPDGNLSSKYIKTSHDVLEGANGLFVLKTSPPRTTIHASPRSRNIPTGSSVMSEASDVMLMDKAGHDRAIRMIEEFYTETSDSTSS
jgi:hypothetical protein